MTALAWDVRPTFVAMPATGETVNSAAFAVPARAGAMQIQAPALVGVATTLKIQSLDPQDQTTWRDVYVFDLTDGTTEALDSIPEGQVTTIPLAATGGGMLRFVASASQASAPLAITVLFSRLM